MGWVPCALKKGPTSMKPTIRRSIRLVALAVTCTVWSSTSAHQDRQASVAGKWTMTVDSPHGTVTMGLVLEQEGKRVTGTFSHLHLGNVTVEGELDGDTMTLATT